MTTREYIDFDIIFFSAFKRRRSRMGNKTSKSQAFRRIKMVQLCKRAEYGRKTKVSYASKHSRTKVSVSLLMYPSGISEEREKTGNSPMEMLFKLIFQEKFNKRMFTVAFVTRAVARALIGGGGSVYSYIRVMPD